jgi:serine/threonine protein kinase
MAGTPNYIAPEVLKEEPFDFKIDNFAIGVILFFMYPCPETG